MSVLAVFAFSEASIAARRRAARWVGELLLAEMPVEVPTDRPVLLRDAGIEREAAELAREQRSMLELVYRSHWLL
ncbi:MULTISPECIES: hypothetical protein [unclassified Ensifer]|uniref:hypothetical protein n=1 Tax=unclassified Ensifer TaxID=2633371 RepID=UPI00081384CD|nr:MULTISPECIES: hypothetical protein [unclassified Ensifer]OCO97999.1 hypothetical protein BBX50_10580 [Ensifer sp. LC11]OCO98614.1 hypothetical protein BC374_10900 [Ensifer sp. LC13]OCP04322.1 hypothetical protein BC362_16330 [Ensifer sp. LC14]OCP29314.1 hypothetical protein BC364_08705 [Ensifer sp. LC499]